MPATLARVALITEEFRWTVELDLSVAVKRKRARVVDGPSFASTEAGAVAENSGIFDLMSADGQLIEVPVDPMPAGISFARLAPTAKLVYEPLGLTREVLIVGKFTEVRRDGVERGKLLLW